METQEQAANLVQLRIRVEPEVLEYLDKEAGLREVARSVVARDIIHAGIEVYRGRRRNST